MGQKFKAKKQQAQKKEDKVFKLYDYTLRFALIYSLYLIVLSSLKYQADVPYTSVFAIIAIILSAKFASIKFFTEQKREFSKPERFKMMWSSWAMAWFITIIITVLSTAFFKGKEELNDLVVVFSAMPTLTFILSILGTSIFVFGLLFLSYGFLASKEFASLKRQEKI